MRRAMLALVLVAAAHGCAPPNGVDAGADATVVDAPAPGDAGPSACGSDTCEPFEYCHSECLCCGTPTMDGGPMPSSIEECRPLSRSCAMDSFCACPQIAETGGICDPARRRLEIPCA